MYHGEVNVAQDDLNSFLAVAEELQLTNKANSAATPELSSKVQLVAPPCMKDSGGPPMKRLRKFSPSRTKPEDDNNEDIKELSVKVNPDISTSEEAVNLAEVYDKAYGDDRSAGLDGDDRSAGLDGDGGDDDPMAGGSSEGAKDTH